MVYFTFDKMSERCALNTLISLMFYLNGLINVLVLRNTNKKTLLLLVSQICSPKQY